MSWSFTCPKPDLRSAEAARARQDRLTKPPGSLGRLESIAVQMASWQARPVPSSRAACILFAADHPVTKHGVSPYPSTVTAAMLANFVGGGAAASVLCNSLRVPLSVVDVGVDGAPLDVPDGALVDLTRARVASLSAGDLRVEDAMSEAVFAGCLEAGANAVNRLDDTTAVLIAGDMGIGNTTVASCLCAALTDGDPEHWVGRGTGASDAMVQTKVSVCRDALRRLSPTDGPLERLRRVGGREIAALFAAYCRALERRMVVLVDGFVTSSAALVLCKLYPEATAGMIFGHQSSERGHARLLQALDASPLLHLDMRLGEASGALVAHSLIQNACALYDNMATFESARVPDRAG